MSDSTEKTGKTVTKGNVVRAYSWSSLGAIFASSGPSVFMLMATGMAKEVSVMYFFFIGGLAALLVGYAWRKFNKDAPREPWNRLLEWQISGRISLAGLAFAAHFVFFICAMQAQSITETIIFVRMNPLIVVFLSVLILKEEIKNWIGVILGTILCLFGIATINRIVSFSPENLLTFFFLFAIIATCSFAFFRVMTVNINRKSELSGGSITGLTMIVGGFGLLIWIIMTGESLILPGVREFLFLSYLGTATVALGVFTNLKAVKLIGRQGKVAFVEYLQAIFGPICAYLINKEGGLDYQVIIIGASFIIGGAIWATLSVKGKNDE